MKKLLLILLLLLNVTVMASAKGLSAEQKIYASVLGALYGESRVKLWCDDEKKAEMLSLLNNIALTKDKSDADILFVFHSLDLESDKPKFVGSYALLKHYKNDVIGGFYWQKGRPNLLFLRSNLKKQHLEVGAALEKFVEDSF